MDFAFTTEQTMLRDSVTRYLEKHYSFESRQALARSGDPFSAEVWKSFADLGLLSLPFPEDVDGLNGSAVDLVAIGEPFGEYLLVEPYLPSIVLAGRALAAAPEQPVARDWLGRIMAGEVLGAFAHEEGRGTAEPSGLATRCRRTGDSYRIDGGKRLVLGGGTADVLVVTAREEEEPGRPVLLVVEPGTDGVRLRPFRTVDGRPAAQVDFDGVEVPAGQCVLSDAAEAITDTVRNAVVALAAEAVGAMGALLRLTGEYARTRKQFGVPIASFQAVAHRLADMKICYVTARATLLYTAALAEAGRATQRDISLLKAQIGRLGRTVGEAAVQTHGGVATTDELVIGHYLKRLVAADAMFGDSGYHVRVVGADAL